MKALNTYVRLFLTIVKIVGWVCFVCLLFSGCTKTIYEPVEKIKTEYSYQIKRDSVYQKDSIYIDRKEDTVFINKYKYLYLDKIRIDTIKQVDSIPYLKEIPVKGDTLYKMKWYEEVFFYIGLMSVLIILLYGVYKYIKKKLGI